MNRIKNYLLWSLIALAITACSTPSHITKDSSVGRNPASHSWANYHWERTAAQFTLKLGDNLTLADWKSHLTQASSDWNSPQLVGALTTPVLTAITAGQSGKRCQMVAGTTQVCNNKYGSNGWLGLASIYISAIDHITQGSVKLNDTYFTLAKYNNANERQHVVCQEMAHTFGLDHQSTDGSSQNSCMDYFSNTGVNATNTASTQPNAHDFEELNIVYAHLDSGTTVSPSVAASAADEITENPQSWGDFMADKSQGSSAFYERAGKDGSRIITHVLWTDERAAQCTSCDHRFER